MGQKVARHQAKPASRKENKNSLCAVDKAFLVTFVARQKYLLEEHSRPTGRRKSVGRTRNDKNK